MMPMGNMTTRERFRAVMNFRSFDRLPIVEWAVWWDETIRRWHGEGLAPSLTDRYDICRHFGQDIYVQAWIPHAREVCPSPSFHGGGIVQTMADYDRIREYLYPWPVVDHKWWSQLAEEQSKGEVVLWFTFEGFFWFPRRLFGIEPHIYAFYDEPELMHRINHDLSEWMIRVIDEICSICVPDFMTFAEDMSYNHGPMLSKKLFDEFMRPYYDKVIPHLKEHDIISIVDSDGDITVASSWFREAGLDGILPLERQAGVDVAEVRGMHPDMRFIGCFDKMVMNQGEAGMREEFERLLPTAAQGGLIVSCDHQTPPGVSYEDYLLYLRLFREYADIAGQMSRK
jgi:hypothetical protein